MIASLIKECRSVRRFSRERVPTPKQLYAFAESAVYVASAGNLQRLRFSVITPDNSDGVFSFISLGGYLPQEEKPTYEQRPSAYIVISSVCEQIDTNLAMDAGIAAEAISLSVSEAGFASCMIRNFKSDGIVEYIGGDGLYPILVIAIGEPAESVRIVDSKDGDVKYYRDVDGVHCVPKFSADKLIIMK